MSNKEEQMKILKSKILTSIEPYEIRTLLTTLEEYGLDALPIMFEILSITGNPDVKTITSNSIARIKQRWPEPK